MKRKIRVGSRDSKLAVIQSQIVIDCIKRYDESIEIELVTMKTTGDKILDRTLDKIGGKGLFVKELEQGLLNGDIDMCVHSLKDMEVVENELLPIVAYGRRSDPRDVLVLPENKPEGEPCPGLPIGSSSSRRAVQLKDIYPHIPVAPVRGNVLTRLNKLDSGGFSGLVLANAGLIRLGLEGRVARIFETDEIVPASCQGVLAVQARKGEDTAYLDAFRCQESTICSRAERTFIRTLNCGCGAPVGVYCTLHQNEIHISGMFYDADSQQIFKSQTAGEAQEGEKLGEALAKEILARVSKGGPA